MKTQDILVKATILITLFSFTFFVNAQTIKKPVKKTIKPTKMVENKPLRDFVFVINIEKNSNVILTVQKTEDSGVLATASNAKPLADFFSGFSNLKRSLTPILIVKANSLLNYSEVINVIQASRISSTQKTKVEISKGFYAVVPPKPDKNNYQDKPNPLTLVVRLDKNTNITLNVEEKGSLNDISLLIDSLKQIFKDRENSGIIREGTNIIETTVFVKAPLSVKFADVIKIAEALREAGSTIVGLQVDDLEQ